MYKRHLLAFAGIIICVLLIVTFYPQQLGQEPQIDRTDQVAPTPPPTGGVQAPTTVTKSTVTAPEPAYTTGSGVHRKGISPLAPKPEPTRPMERPEPRTAPFTFLLRDTLTEMELGPTRKVLNLALAQTQFKAAALVDTNGDDTGEFGFLKELAGTMGFRDPLGIPQTPGQYTGLLASWTGKVDRRGIVVHEGYCYRVFLPDRAGRGRHESELAYPADIDASHAAKHWCVYMWPEVFDPTCRRVFFMNEKGQLLCSANTSTRYSGNDRTPTWDAAYPIGTTTMAGGDCRNGTGRDGAKWLLVK